MKWLTMLLVLLLAGCTVTMTGTARWSEPDAPDVEWREKHEKLSAVVRSMTQELAAAPDDISAVNKVLLKYGVNRTK